ncbi:bola protein [Coniochaeta sp. 2T2.1]|nr:bola protein [Coniochaeta sp. 2T2.1]
MLCRTCIRGSVARQSSIPSAPLRTPSASLRASTFSLPQTSRPSFCSAAAIRTHVSRSPPILRRSTVMLNQRTYSTSTPAESQTSATASSEAPAAPEKPDFLNDAESTIWDMLVAEFAPTELVVQDISGGCGSMYGIEISSEKFRGANMLKQQRMVNAVLGDLMKNWHGVQLKTRVPQ